MKKIAANVLVSLFVLMILGSSTQAAKMHRQPGDVAGAMGELTAYLLQFVGLFYSARWSVKLSGHTHTIGRQTVAAILFWYSLLAVFLGIVMAAERIGGVGFGISMVVVWAFAAYACRRWLLRLRVEEQRHSSISQALG